MRLRNLLALPPLAALAAAAVLATAGGGGSKPPQQPRPAAAAWQGLVGDPRPQVAIGQRMLVVLAAPSLADMVTRHAGIADDASERRWTAAAYAAQQQFLASLASKGVRVRPEHRFARVLNGFSAPLDPRAVALLERTPGVLGVYPVRAAYPATAGVEPIGQDELRDALTYRPRTALAGRDGTGVTIALLDTGVDTSTPFLHGHVLPGLDVVGNGPDARAHAKPYDRLQIEAHGTELAGMLVGAGGPAGLTGVAPGATVFPLRVAGWQRDAHGEWRIYGRSDQLLAGLERAVDPNGDGDAHDAARIALIGLSEPFAAFADDPLARAAKGALRLDTIVVAPAGNDGPAGPSFGSVSGPAGAPSVLAVGAADLRPKAEAVRLVARAGLEVLLDRVVPLAGAVAPPSVSAELVAPPRLFEPGGLSAVAGHALLLDAGTAPRAAAEEASEAGAAALIFAGGVPAGSLGLDEHVSAPALALPTTAAARLSAALKDGRRVQIELARPRLVDNPAVMRLASFSSWGLAFDATPKPDLIASGVGVPTAEPGATAGESTFTTVNGSSAAAATVAGAAALLLQARPDVGAQSLRSLLTGSARPLPRQPVAAQGAGVLDVGAAAAAELATLPSSVSFGRGTGDGWSARRTVLVRNVSSRPLVVYATLGSDAARRKQLALTASPKRFTLAANATAPVTLSAHVVGYPRGTALAGALTLTAVGGRALRVPWSVVLEPPGPLLGPLQLSARSFAPSEVRPAVLSLQAGRVAQLETGEVVEPVLRLDVELWTLSGKRLGLLARVRDLLPGRYAFGLTGRGPKGHVLHAGRYRLRLVAWPTAGGPPSVRSIPFEVARAKPG
jgi:subtilisin family serine protease